MLRTLISRTRVILATLVVLLITGTFAYINIPKESRPDVSIPTMYVGLIYTGISPEDAVNQLLKPMEKQMRGLSGLKELRGTAYEGGANLIIEFEAGFDPVSALADVRAKVDLAKGELPEDAEEPTVTEINLSLFPIATVVLNGDLPERALKRYAEDLQDRLESLPGVLEAPINGLREEMLLIELDKAKLESYGLPLDQVLQVVRTNNALVAAGSLETERGKYAVKIPGLFTSAEDLLNIPLRSTTESTVRVRDVGEVKLAFKDPVSIARVNGKPSITVDVKKRIGENVIETVEAVKETVAKEAENWPAHLTYRIINDDSKQIRIMLSDLQNSVLLATLMVMLVVLLALGWRGASLVAVTVPGSFLAAIFMLYMFGFTTNIVVLFALILSVGILVDAAIVVTEMADRNLALGMEKREAYIGAAEYMAFPVATSTLTILAAFLPLLFWPDIVGEFMRYMPITIFYTLIASWVMAMIFLPTLGSVLPGKPSKQELAPSDFYETLSQRYVAWLEWALGRARGIVLGAVGVLVAVMVLYGLTGKGVEFFPRIEPDRVQLAVHVSGDLSLAEKDALMQRIQAPLIGMDGVETLNVVTGGSSGPQSSASDVIGQITFELTDWSTGRETSDVIMADALSRIGEIPGVSLEENEERGGPQQGKPIQVVVRGPTVDAIRPVIEALRNGMEEIQGVTDITDDLPKPGIEWALEVDRVEASKLGTNIASIGQTIRLATNGAILGTYRPASLKEEIDIVARLRPNERSLSTLDNIMVATADGQVPVQDVTRRVPVPKVDVINRVDQENAVKIEADVEEGTLASNVVAALQQGIAERQLPPGIDIIFKGDQDSQDTAAAFLRNAFVAAVFLIALIMLIEFNSFYQCLVVLSAVVFSTAGVMMGHIISGKPFGIVMSGLGVIALAGIIVSNNIVLIDTYNKLRTEKSWREALMETCRLRLRPVLLTQITTVAGLLPMALKVNIDIVGRALTYNAPSAQWWDQLSTAIIFGIVFGSVLTLVVTPCMLALPEIRRERKPT